MRNYVILFFQINQEKNKQIKKLINKFAFEEGKKE